MPYEIPVQTRSRCQLVDITSAVQRALRDLGLKEGLLTVFVPHTTAGITIQENADPDVVSDLLMELERIVPFEDGYRHSEGNSAAHIKSSLMGSSVQVLVEGGEILFGTWQGIYFCEFDGPRHRKVWVKAVATGVV
jgi:secondary thiamine-phosphate synthase enzyme